MQSLLSSFSGGRAHVTRCDTHLDADSNTEPVRGHKAGHGPSAGAPGPGQRRAAGADRHGAAHGRRLLHSGRGEDRPQAGEAPGSTVGLWRFTVAQSEGFEHQHSCSCCYCSSLGSLPQVYSAHFLQQQQRLAGLNT